MHAFLAHLTVLDVGVVAGAFVLGLAAGVLLASRRWSSDGRRDG